MSTMVQTRCLCGTVVFEVDGAADHAGHCHCDNCRRAHGAAFWSWATYAHEKVRCVRGEDALTAFTCDVGSTRKFCSRCGAILWYESPRWPGKVDLSLANFDEYAGPNPTRRVYADRAPSWDPIADDLPRFGGPDGTAPL